MTYNGDVKPYSLTHQDIKCAQKSFNTSQIIYISPILTDIFQVDVGQLVPECLHSGFYWRKDRGGGNSWSYKTCKAPVTSSPPANQHPVFFTHRMPFLSPVKALKGFIDGTYLVIIYMTIIIQLYHKMEHTSRLTIVDRAERTPEANLDASIRNCASMRNTPQTQKFNDRRRLTNCRITGM